MNRYTVGCCLRIIVEYLLNFNWCSAVKVLPELVASRRWLDAARGEAVLVRSVMLAMPHHLDSRDGLELGCDHDLASDDVNANADDTVILQGSRPHGPQGHDLSFSI